MKLERQLARWQEAGLIDAETGRRIRDYEAARPTRPYILYAALGLGALSVAIGLVSIVAANWGEITAQTKLALDLGLLCGLAAGIFFADRASRGGTEHGPTLARDALLFIYYGAILASIGLIGQVYQLGGELHQALLLWSAITLPLVAFARAGFVFATVLIALQVTAMANLESLVGLRGRAAELALITGVATLPQLLIGLALIRPLARWRPELCATAAGLGIAEWLFTATISQFVWYDRGRYANVDGASLYALAPVLLSVALARAVPAQLDGKGRRGLQALLLLGPSFGYLPLLVHHGSAGLVGAAGFLVLWGLIGWTALRLGRLELFNLATAFLALRLLGIYFELFGSLLNTGIGLLSGGLLTLLLAWLWVTIRRKKRPPTAAPLPLAAAPTPAAAAPADVPRAEEDPRD